MKKKLIIVSPHFPPTNAADHQRVRMALPYLQENGWQVTVICVEAQDVDAPIDPFLSQTVPDNVDVIRVNVPAGRWTKLPGFGSLGYRCTPAIKGALEAHLKLAQNQKEPTLVYFSSTQFPIHRIIPALKSRWKIPIAMDFQDSWATDYYRLNPQTLPPGGRLKFGIANWLAFREESRVVDHLAGITAVSAGYTAELNQRYPWISKIPQLIQPFGAAESDFKVLRKSNPTQKFFTKSPDTINWVYVGRGGEDMDKATRAFFCAFDQARKNFETLRKVRIHFIGTDYAASSRAKCSIVPIAEEAGVLDQVFEYPQRIPFSEALSCLLDANALIVPGSDDSNYTASKIYPYLLAEKPMLTVFHEESSVVNVVKNCSSGVCVTFNSAETSESLSARIYSNWFATEAWAKKTKLDREAFLPYSATEMSKTLSEFLSNLHPRVPDTAV